MRVFWPTNIERRTGTAVGWRLGDSGEILVIVDVVENEAVPAIDPPLEPLAHVLAGASAPESDSSAGLTIWADPSPVAYSLHVETVLFTPMRDLTLPADEGEEAGYGVPVAADLRGLLGTLNAVASAQDQLRGRRPAPSTPMGGVTFLAPWLLLGAGMVYSSLLTRTTSTLLAVAMASALLFQGLIRGPPRRASVRSPLDRLCLLPLPLSSALCYQIKQRAVTIAELLECPMDNRNSVAHSASAAAVNMDLLLGALVGVLLLAHPHLPIPPDVADTLTLPIIAALRWLDDWPFGLKLNTGLSAFLCDSITHVLGYWRDAASPILVHALPHLSTTLALVCSFGVSFGVALSSDLLTLLTLHLRLIYLATAALSRASMTALLGLWDLFRGRRWNVLRHRTDSHAFEVDTLFLGTLLFTVTAFLAPTVLAYGLLFSLINFVISSAQRVLSVVIAGINRSVAFQLAASLPPFQGIPDGIVFDIVSASTRGQAAAGPYPVHHALELKRTSMGAGALLGHWWRDALLTAR
ncbi:Gpi1-domain-containing protein [Cutaneotrichosporon oleaginosum]|uniref:Gpi1-domain-containing protein n=1 Tax=Cutaneotrichosporon oleaginosum TaxID=879819 RepID=A0A0J0XNG8_9TREE|nr:Gpi1-domain-containing protein [Cutaneotrichosporon oleaginosum]KLT42622.1 Gpi1-domain-containing protein [Cutaneotrichosporon oleaginosum]TXT05261.1 hypothetical protein COLE_06581 [Cutaneotrichosporon oleaginosum]